MPRPEIPQSQKERIEEIHEDAQGFEANSFQEALSTVIDLAEVSLDKHYMLSEGQFTVTVDEEDSSINIEPTEISSLEFEYFQKGDPPNTVLLNTGIAWIGQDPIEEAIESVDEVEKGYIGLTTGVITVEYRSDGEEPRIIAEKLLHRISELIESYETEVLEGEATRKEQREDAIAPYWPHIR